MQTLQSDIDGITRAIQHLIGERKALTDRLARDEAHLKMLAAKMYAAEHPPHPPVQGVPSGQRFPDLSSYQTHVDLPTVHLDSRDKAGELVVFKATEGLGYTDAYIVSRWREAGGMFPHRGAYHFLHPSESGRAQAEYFLNELHRASTDGVGPKAQDIVVCDAEVSDGQSARLVAQCVAEFGAYLLGNSPAKRWLYTGGPFAEEFGLQLAPFDAHWLPAYVSDPRPYYVKRFGAPIAWQYTDGIHGPTPKGIAGIGPCDLSIIL